MSNEFDKLLSGDAYIDWFMNEATPQDILEDFPEDRQQLWLIGSVISSLPIDQLDEHDTKLCRSIMQILSYDCPDDIKKLFIEDIIAESWSSTEEKS